MLVSSEHKHVLQLLLGSWADSQPATSPAPRAGHLPLPVALHFATARPGHRKPACLLGRRRQGFSRCAGVPCLRSTTRRPPHGGGPGRAKSAIWGLDPAAPGLDLHVPAGGGAVVAVTRLRCLGPRPRSLGARRRGRSLPLRCSRPSCSRVRSLAFSGTRSFSPPTTEV
jgi:hypothetical protein